MIKRFSTRIIPMAALLIATATAWGQTANKDVVVSKIGRGKVVSSVPGIDCGAQCTTHFPLGTPVVLTATPQPGWTFKGWGLDCTNAGKAPACTLSMSTDIPGGRVKVALAFEKQGLFSTSLWDLGKNKSFLALDGVPEGQEMVVHRDSIPPKSGFQVIVNEAIGSVGMKFYREDPEPVGRLDKAAPFVLYADDQDNPVPMPALPKGSYQLDVTLFDGPAATSDVIAVRRYELKVKTDSLTLALRLYGKGSVAFAKKNSLCWSGMLCEADYRDTLPNKTETLTATPAPGWIFRGWFDVAGDSGIDGKCKGLGACAVTIKDNMVVTAEFDKPGFLTASLWDIEKKKVISNLKLPPPNDIDFYWDTLLLDTLPERFTVTATTLEPASSVYFSIIAGGKLDEEYVDHGAPFYLNEDAKGAPTPWVATKGAQSIVVSAFSGDYDKINTDPTVYPLKGQTFYLTVIGKTVAIRSSREPARDLPTVHAGKNGLELTVRKTGFLELALTDVAGKSIPLEGRIFQTGKHTVRLPAGRIGKGIHYLRLSGPGLSLTRQVVLMGAP